jgi:peptidoglycan/LPS O-acetylase OafA/YrhL
MSKELHHANNFDALRLLAAILVIVGHSFELLDRPHFGLKGDPFANLTRTDSLGAIAVITFFSISGYLVANSLSRCDSIGEFLWKRALRVLPALWVLIAVSVFFWGPGLTNLSLGDYFRSPVTHDYLSWMLLRIREVLPGVFDANPRTAGFNGSLWTLPMEIRCYAALALVGLFRRRFLKPALCLGIAMLLVAAARTIIKNPFRFPGFGLESTIIVKLTLPFFVGAAVALWRKERWLVPRLGVALFFVLCAIGMLPYPSHTWMWLPFCLVVGYCALAIGFHTKPLLSSITQRGDFSYGLYLWAFPVQQTIISFFPQVHVAALIVVTFLVTSLCAVLSWHFVEAPMLRDKHRYSEWRARVLRFLPSLLRRRSVT